MTHRNTQQLVGGLSECGGLMLWVVPDCQVDDPLDTPPQLPSLRVLRTMRRR